MCIYVVCIHVGLGMCLWRPKVNTECPARDLPAFTSLVLGLQVSAVHPNAGTLPVAASMAGSLLVVSRLTSPRIYFLSGRSDSVCGSVFDL